MTPFTRAGIAKSWALVAAVGILATAGIEAYALSQGVEGTAPTASPAAIEVLGGASIIGEINATPRSDWTPAQMRDLINLVAQDITK